MCVRKSVEFREPRVTPGEDLVKVSSVHKSPEAEYGSHISNICSRSKNDKLRLILRLESISSKRLTENY